MAEGRQAEEPFAAGAKAGAGGADHVALVQELVEEVPTTHPAGGLEPDVGGISEIQGHHTNLLHKEGRPPG